MIFGRKNYNWSQDWYVRLNCMDGNSFKIAEQLRKPEAQAIYEEVKKQLKDKTDFIEIETELDSKTEEHEFFLKKNILSVEVTKR